jgi:hypothetical protein
MYRRSRNVALTLAVLVAVSLVAALGGNAAPRQQLTWTEGAADITVLDSRTVGGNLIEEHIWVRDVTGDLTGTVTETFRVITHPDGHATFQGRAAFTGTTPCGTGSFDAGFAGTGDTITGVFTGPWGSVDGGRNSAHILLTGSFLTVFPVTTVTADYRCT